MMVGIAGVVVADKGWLTAGIADEEKEKAGDEALGWAAGRDGVKEKASCCNKVAACPSKDSWAASW